jgi:hypothetical protein
MGGKQRPQHHGAGVDEAAEGEHQQPGRKQDQQQLDEAEDLEAAGCAKEGEIE